MKTLGQIAYEAWTGDGHGWGKWDQLTESQRESWESVAKAVRDAPEPKTPGQAAFEMARELGWHQDPRGWAHVHPESQRQWEAIAKAAREA